MVMMMVRGIGAHGVEVVSDLERRRCRDMMIQSARRLDDSRHALNGQGGYQQPKQKCLEKAIHVEIIWRR